MEDDNIADQDHPAGHPDAKKDFAYFVYRLTASQQPDMVEQLGRGLGVV